MIRLTLHLCVVVAMILGLAWLGSGPRAAECQSPELAIAELRGLAIFTGVTADWELMPPEPDGRQVLRTRFAAEPWRGHLFEGGCYARPLRDGPLVAEMVSWVGA